MATTMLSKLHPTRNDMPEATRAKVTDYLNNSLAACLDLYSQTKQAHWNVKGKDFYQLHLLFDELAKEVLEYVDLIAERVTTLGGTAMGTVHMAAKQSVLPDYPVDVLNGLDHVSALADRYAKFGKLVREGIDKTDEWGDKDTADVYTEISRTIDMRLWFLEAHLEGK